ncbi:hypothetical protein AAE478_005582 [Parahypoxylon ruwenzoriense]
MATASQGSSPPGHLGDDKRSEMSKDGGTISNYAGSLKSYFSSKSSRRQRKGKDVVTKVFGNTQPSVTVSSSNGTSFEGKPDGYHLNTFSSIQYYNASLSKASHGERSMGEKPEHETSKNTVSNGEKLVDGAAKSEPTGPSGDSSPGIRRFLPGCSAGEFNGKDKTQVISNAMMLAYVKMRGPDMKGDDDPLFEWIYLRKGLAVKHSDNYNVQETDERDVSIMLKHIDKALDSENMGGDSPRDAIFEIKKPKINHIEPPADIDLTLHALTAGGADFGFQGDYDEDDEEGCVPGGRISPCTFLAWSRGCKKWDDSNIKDPERALSNETRHRPPTPEYPTLRKEHYPYYYVTARSQVDENTGEKISPYYDVPTNPSIIYSPPGVPEKIYGSANFQGKYSRMAPLDAKALLDQRYGKATASMAPAYDNESYGFTEVEAVTNNMGRINLGVSLEGCSELHSFINAQWRAIKEQEAQEQALSAEIAMQTRQIRELELEREKLQTLYIPLLHKRREYRQREHQQLVELEWEQRRRQREEQEREGRVREHVATCARDAHHRLDTAFLRRQSAQRARDRGAERLARLEQEIGEECLMVGATCPQAVYDEVRGDISPVLPMLLAGEFGSEFGLDRHQQYAQPLRQSGDQSGDEDDEGPLGPYSAKAYREPEQGQMEWEQEEEGDDGGEGSSGTQKLVPNGGGEDDDGDYGGGSIGSLQYKCNSAESTIPNAGSEPRHYFDSV